MSDNEEKEFQAVDKTLLISFLKELINGIEEDTMFQEDLKDISEFYMTYKCKKDQHSKEEDFFKFVVMGWYVYNSINPSSESKEEKDYLDDDDLDDHLRNVNLGFC
jgi:hypothetical protein